MENKTVFNDPGKAKKTKEEIANYFKAPDYGAKFRELGKKIFGGSEEAQASENPQSEALKRMRSGQ